MRIGSIVVVGAMLSGMLLTAGCGGDSGGPHFKAAPHVAQGSCQPSSSLSVLVSGKNVVSYVPKGNWEGGSTGVALIQIEGSGTTPGVISTPNVVNSCASNSKTGGTVCVSNGTDVYLISGSTLDTTKTSGAVGTSNFTGGSCMNCGISVNGTTNQAIIALNVGPGDDVGGFQFLDLTGTPTFETPFASMAATGGLSNIAEDALVDPIRNLLLSPNELGNYELINVKTTTSPSFFENSGFEADFDSAAEDCSTGIALSSIEFTSSVFIASLKGAHFTSGSPGSWTAPSQIQALDEVALSAGTSGIAVAQGTHTGIITGEFGGANVVAMKLPSSAGGGTPSVQDWVQCPISGSFSTGDDPHTTTAYQSPNTHHAIGLVADEVPANVAVIDLTKMLDKSIVARDAGGHVCTGGDLVTLGVATLVAVP